MHCWQLRKQERKLGVDFRDIPGTDGELFLIFDSDWLKMLELLTVDFI